LKLTNTITMKTKATFISLLFVVTLPLHSQIPNTKLNSLKVMTWNVWYGFSQFKESNGIFPVGHPYVANQTVVQKKATEFLISQAPDVIALQELKRFNSKKLATFASSYGHSYSIIFNRKTQQPTGLTSKYPIDFLEGNHANYNGTDLAGTFAAKLRNNPIVFIVVHLRSNNKRNREIESRYALELYQKYRDLDNHVILLGDFNSHTITDRKYLETHISKRLAYRIFKNKCNHELNNSNEPDSGMEACTTWDYGVMERYWKYNTDPIEDTTHKHANRITYENSGFWGTFPTTSVKIFHDKSNLDEHGKPTTKHTQLEHLSRIDYILANKSLANLTRDARIIHGYINHDNTTVLIDEMSDHYPLVTTFSKITK
jgi:exonuclease III